MKISILTYNVRFNQATVDLPELVKIYNPDLICLQEVETSEKHFSLLQNQKLHIADYSNSFIRFGKVFGLVTFFNPHVFRCTETKSFDIPRSFYEALEIIFRGFNNPRTTIKTEFEHIETGEKLVLYNMHLSPLYARNSTRMKQLLETFKDLDIPENDHVLIAGDLNFPYGRKKLEEITQDYHLEEATNDLFFTHENTFFKLFHFRLKLDYIFYKNLKKLVTKKIDRQFSDHYPIYAEFEF